MNIEHKVYLANDLKQTEMHTPQTLKDALNGSMDLNCKRMTQGYPYLEAK